MSHCRNTSIGSEKPARPSAQLAKPTTNQSSTTSWSAPHTEPRGDRWTAHCDEQHSQHTPGKPQGIHTPVPIHKRHATFPAPSCRFLMNAEPAVHAAPTPKPSVHCSYPHQPLEGTPLPALPLKPLKRTETNLDIERIEPDYCM